MKRVMTRCCLLSLAAWQLSMARGVELYSTRIELADNPFLPIAGLQVVEDGSRFKATILSDLPKSFKVTLAEPTGACEAGESVKVQENYVDFPIPVKGFYKVCVKPTGGSGWQSFSFLGSKVQMQEFSLGSIEGLPEKKSSDRILKMHLPFEFAREVHVGIGKSPQCNEDMAVVDPNVIFSYDLGTLGGKSTPVFLCFSGTKEDGSKFDVLRYSFQYVCTSGSGECQGSGLGREADIQFALQTLRPDEFGDRKGARESWSRLGLAGLESEASLEKESASKSNPEQLSSLR